MKSLLITPATWITRTDSQGRLYRPEQLAIYQDEPDMRVYIRVICVHDPKACTAQSRVNLESRFFLDDWLRLPEAK